MLTLTELLLFALTTLLLMLTLGAGRIAAVLARSRGCIAARRYLMGTCSARWRCAWPSPTPSEVAAGTRPAAGVCQNG